MGEVSPEQFRACPELLRRLEIPFDIPAGFRLHEGEPPEVLISRLQAMAIPTEEVRELGAG